MLFKDQLTWIKASILYVKPKLLISANTATMVRLVVIVECFFQHT